MPLKITTSNRAKHEVAENISTNDLLTGKTKRKGWVRVKPKPPSDGVVVYVQLRQIVEVRDEPDPKPAASVTRRRGRIPTPQRD
jgi:hypothetical protein